VKPYVALVLPLLCAYAPVHADPASIDSAVADHDAVVSSHGFEAGAEVADAGPRPPVRVPRTPFDTAHRFNMDSGKKLTAAEFDAWLASMGARVVVAEPVVAVVEDAGEDIDTGEVLASAEAPPSILEPELPAQPQTVKNQVVE
jgi:hypothetical protein